MSQLIGRNSFQVHTFICEFEEGGKVRTGKHTYYGDFLTALFACQEEHMWSKSPSFRIVNVIPREI